MQCLGLADRERHVLFAAFMLYRRRDIKRLVQLGVVPFGTAWRARAARFDAAGF